MEKRSPHGRRALDDALFKLPFGVMVADTQGLILNINDAFTAITGYSLQDMAHKRLDRVLNGPLTDTSTLNDMADALKSLTKFNAQLMHYKKNGETFADQYSISPIFNSEGVFSNFIATSQDAGQFNPQHHLHGFALSQHEIEALFGPKDQ